MVRIRWIRFISGGTFCGKEIGMYDGDAKGLAISAVIGIGLGLLIFICIVMLVGSSYTTYRLTYVQNGKEITRIVEGYPLSTLANGIIARKNQLMPVTFECTDCYVKQIEEIKE